MKWICVRCKAINPQFSVKCHNFQCGMNAVVLELFATDLASGHDPEKLGKKPSDFCISYQTFFKAGAIRYTSPNGIQHVLKDRFNALITREMMNEMAKELPGHRHRSGTDCQLCNGTSELERGSG